MSSLVGVGVEGKGCGGIFIFWWLEDANGGSDPEIMIYTHNLLQNKLHTTQPWKITQIMQIRN